MQRSARHSQSLACDFIGRSIFQVWMRHAVMKRLY
jgi:hypothetical protein